MAKPDTGASVLDSITHTLTPEIQELTQESPGIRQVPHQHEFAGFGASHLVTALLLSTPPPPETSRREQRPELVLMIKKGREETAGT